MPSFWITHINKTKNIFIQYFNFEILVYIPTTISHCNYTPQFKNNVCSIGMLAHMRQELLKLYITDLYEYCIFVEYLRYKVLLFFCAGYLVEK